MIYITGDTHGDISRFKSKAFRRLKKNDYLIICGDFGFIWDGSPKEKKILKWLGKRRYHVLFVEGVHDNLNLINQYPRVPWNGGEVHEISGRLRHLCRGGIFNLGGFTVLAFGGGEILGSDLDAGDLPWDDDLLPSETQLSAARKNFFANQLKVDYIVTHQCCRRFKNLLTMKDNDPNPMDSFFEEIRESGTYRYWFFGGFHIDKPIPPREIALFNKIVPADRPYPAGKKRGYKAKNG